MNIFKPSRDCKILSNTVIYEHLFMFQWAVAESMSQEKNQQELKAPFIKNLITLFSFVGTYF